MDIHVSQIYDLFNLGLLLRTPFVDLTVDIGYGIMQVDEGECNGKNNKDYGSEQEKGEGAQIVFSHTGLLFYRLVFIEQFSKII